MPLRKVPLVTNQIYHIVNRGIASMLIFKKHYDYVRFLRTISYYQFQSPPVKFSTFLTYPKRQKEILRVLKKDNKRLVDILSYCLMPNHTHLLLKQKQDEGIMNFMRLVFNSYSRYFNTKYERKGSLTEGRFMNRRIENDNQLLHVHRYIHLNPYTSFLVKDSDELLEYSYSSLLEYLNNSKTEICNTKEILGHFKNSKSYRIFILNNSEYQKSLQIIKHKILE